MAKTKQKKEEKNVEVRTEYIPIERYLFESTKILHQKQDQILNEIKAIKEVLKFNSENK